MIDYSTLPKDPGCYLYKDEKGKVIYVGKAKVLRKRVAQYFQKRDHDPKTEQLVAHIRDVEVIVTNTETEALLLENTLIKKYQPKYNIDWKDSKRFTMLELTSEKYPRLMVARRKDPKKKQFGPFVSGYDRIQLNKLLNKLFLIRTCKRLPKRACLRYHIGICSGPCVDAISEADYQENLKKAEMVLTGKTKELVDGLRVEMDAASKRMDFERAMQHRDTIYALERLNEKQQMQRTRKYDQDIFNYVVKEGYVYLLVFNIYKGTLTNKKEFSFEYSDGCIDEFLVQYYSEEATNEGNIPDEVVVPHAVDAVMGDFLTELRRESVFDGKKNAKHVSVVVPKIGDRKQLLALVKKNVEIHFFGDVGRVLELKKMLKLQFTPSVIECFDISHLSGTSTVGSMVQFRNGKADKSNYRRFKIRTVEGIDDFSSIGEVVLRRYKRLRDESSAMPDLVVIDGGRGQLNAAIKSLKEIGVHLPIIGLAKRLEEIYVPGLVKPLLFDHTEKGLQYLQSIRDEAHRFAITYNKLLRKKKLREE